MSSMNHRWFQILAWSLKNPKMMDFDESVKNLEKQKTVLIGKTWILDFRLNQIIVQDSNATVWYRTAFHHWEKMSNFGSSDD